MQKSLLKPFLWAAVLISPLYTQKAVGNIPEQPQLQELTFSVSLRDLDFDQEGIFVNVDGHIYGVRSLEKKGNQWIAKAIAGYCPKGHPVCGNCVVLPICQA